MALTFPLNPPIGSTYQSGSSNTYEWTGTYWKIKNVINFNQFSASISDRVTNATNEQNISNLATTGSNVFSGSQYISGSLVPAVADGTFTSSFTLGTATNAWKDLYISHGSIIFVDAITQATSSFSIATSPDAGENAVQYTAGITASYYLGDGGGLYNLPANTNWHIGDSILVRKTEQLTFSGDYTLENASMIIEGGTPNSIGEWTTETWNTNATYSRNGNNGYTITGPTDDTNASVGVWMHRQFDTNTTMSIQYVWNGTDVGNDWPIYDVQNQYPYEINTENRLQNTNATTENGTWTINVPSGSWLAIGVNTANSNNTAGILQLTFPYLFGEDVQYAPNKYFKKEGSIFIGGNLLLKDSTIENNGKIYVGGEVILIGDSQITGTGTII